MHYLVTSAEMKRYDNNCISRIGIPSMVLMERAALETFYVLKEKGFLHGTALILAGYGNNGGDGLALARLLCEAGVDICVYLIGDETKASSQWKQQRDILRNYPISFVDEPLQSAYTLIIDALFGVGLSRDVTGAWEKGINNVNKLKGYKVSLDVPSGVNADNGAILGTAFEADLTVTYGFEKKGLYLYPGSLKTGEVRLADIGITKYSFFEERPQCFALDEPLERLLPARRKDGNKGSFGKTLIIAGSKNVAGAAILCANACYRLGAGMVKVLTSGENRVILQQTVPEALLGDLENEEEFIRSLGWCDAICIGPGLGSGPAALNALRHVLSDPDGMKKPLVMDADALNLLAQNEDLQRILSKQGEEGRTIVLTPHPGELQRLCKGLFAEWAELTVSDLKRELESHGMKVAAKLSSILVAKDARTFICKKDQPVCLNLSGNDGMGTAGSGDVLAGMIAAFLCQMEATKEKETYDESLDLDFYMTCRAVRAHGILGDLAANGMLGEHGIMAGDLVKMISQ